MSLPIEKVERVQPSYQLMCKLEGSPLYKGVSIVYYLTGDLERIVDVSW